MKYNKNNSLEVVKKNIFIINYKIKQTSLIEQPPFILLRRKKHITHVKHKSSPHVRSCPLNSNFILGLTKIINIHVKTYTLKHL